MGSQVNCEAPWPHDVFNVLVTGFGAFKEQYPRQRPKIPAVRIYVHPAPIRVSYRVVRNIVPKLWECTATREDSDSHRDVPLETPVHRTPDRDEDGPPPGTRIDLVIHIGMAGPRLVYQVEALGHRDGYVLPDVDGCRLGDEDPDPFTGKLPRDADDWPWKGTPEELRTAFELGEVQRRWGELVSERAPLYVSKDPGRYLCDFIYFSSLAYLFRREERRRVVFLHVPSYGEGRMISQGREIALGLIQALVESQLCGQGDGNGNGEPSG